jgi:hypothetical protein
MYSTPVLGHQTDNHVVVIQAIELTILREIIAFLHLHIPSFLECEECDVRRSVFDKSNKAALAHKDLQLTRSRFCVR